MPTLNAVSAVKERYSAGAQAAEEALCYAAEYNLEFVKIKPAEVIERDNGCGDPSKYPRPRETVHDLESGSGKSCFIASQAVGPERRVGL